MISFPLCKREWKANFKIILIFIALLTMYSSLIVAMYDPKLGESLNMMKDSMPEIFAAFQMSDPGSTLIEFVGNYLYGFILVVIPMIALLILANRLVSRYIDRGSMAYLLATPNNRRKIISTQAFTIILSACLFVVYAMALIFVCASFMFNETIDFGILLNLNIGLLGLQLAVGGLCFFFSCIFNESKYALGFGGGCTVFFILVQMLSQVGDKLEFLKYLTPLTLFQVNGLINGDQNAIFAYLSLYAIAIICFLAGIIIFKKRDLPL